MDDNEIIDQLNRLNYKHKKEAMEQIKDATEKYKDLQLVHVTNGSQGQVLALKGTIPVQHKRSTRNIPITIEISQDFPTPEPFHVPIVEIVPSPTMEIITNQNVGLDRRARFSLLDRWANKGRNGEIVEVIQRLQSSFEQFSPVRAKPIDAFDSGPIDYHLKTNNKVYIISNRFEDIKAACEKNEDDIDKTFSDFNFHVKKMVDLSVAKMTGIIEFIRDEDFSKHECLVLYLLGHGSDRKTHSERNGNYILGIDKQPLDINWIVETLQDNETLNGKPKLIFSDLCRGEKEMEVLVVRNNSQATDGAVELQARRTDTFLFHATSTGYKAWGNSTSGSCFTFALCRAMKGLFGQNEMNTRSKYHLGDVVTKVNEYLARDGDQTSEAHSSLAKNVYFYKPNQRHFK